MLTDDGSRSLDLRKLNILIDTNIFLDVFLQRTQFYKDSQSLLKLCEEHEINGFLTASSITDIFYILQRCLHDTEASYDALGAVLDIARVIPVTGEDVLEAYAQKAPDFEDCLLATCARSFGCNAIVTRNGKDFKSFGVETVEPKYLLDTFSDQE